MSRILLDGESVYEASVAIGELKNNSMNIAKYDALMNVIYGIVLWDEVYVMEEMFNSHFLSGVDFFKQYEIRFRILSKQAVSPIIQKLSLEHFFEYKMPESEVQNIEPNENGMYTSSKVLEILFGKRGYYEINNDGKRALDYWLVANENGLDYMPSVKRLLILQSYDFLNFFNRKDVINKLDSELCGFYEELNALIGKDVIRYRFPVLLDYILDKYGNIEDIVKYAFELKYDPKVVKFRKEIDNLEEAFLRGSLLEIKSYFENIKETIEDISKTKGIDRSIDITLSFPPALSTSIDLPKARPNQCLFIKDLAYYGINERIPKPLPNGKLYT